jgi:membrane-bound serine protease (ClpP class)
MGVALCAILLGGLLALAGNDAPVVYVVPVEGTIDLGLAPFVERSLDLAAAENAAAVVLDIDTFGGRVDAAVQIRDALLASPVTTVAWVHPRAISAGALISLAAERIAVAPGSTIGAATPVNVGAGGETTATDEKTVSYVRTEFATTAETRGRPVEIAEAMVDRDVAIEGLVKEGKLLTLRGEQALERGVADFEAADMESLLAQLDLAGATVRRARENWAERIAGFLTGPIVSSLLLSLGFLGLIVEFYTQGLGWSGALGVIFILLFFFGHYIVNLAGWEEFLVFLLGVGLLLLEILVIPGFGVAGVSGLLLVLISLVLSLLGLPLRASWALGLVDRALTIVGLAFILAIVVAVILARTVLSSRLGRRLVLAGRLSSMAEVEAEEQGEWDPLGAEGVALTDLHPAGKARVAGRKLDVISEGGLIPRDTPVIVVGRRTGSYVVRAKRES